MPDTIVRLHVGSLATAAGPANVYRIAATDRDTEVIHQELADEAAKLYFTRPDNPRIHFTHVDLPLPADVVARLADTEHDFVTIMDDDPMDPSTGQIILRYPRGTDWKALCHKAITDWCSDGEGKAVHETFGRFTWADMPGVNADFLAKYGLEVIDRRGPIELVDMFREDLVDSVPVDDDSSETASDDTGET